MKLSEDQRELFENEIKVFFKGIELVVINDLGMIFSPLLKLKIDPNIVENESLQSEEEYIPLVYIKTNILDQKLEF